jgi:hypothetical protein
LKKNRVEMRAKISRMLCGVAVILCWAGASTAATIVLDFKSLNPTDTSGPLFVQSPYTNQGFSLSSTLGFNTYGSGLANFYAGVASLSPIIGSDVELKATDNSPFSLTSILLTRNFAFDPAPTVTFTGAVAGGGTVTQTFSVTTPLGVPSFQTFQFTGFANVLRVDWSQPASVVGGLHQFADVTIETGPTAIPEPGPTAIPEPASVVLLNVGLVGSILIARGKRK